MPSMPSLASRGLGFACPLWTEANGEVVLHWAQAGPEANPWKGSKSRYNQKHMDTETSIPKSGPKRLNLPHQVCVGGGEGVDNQTGVL